MVGGLKLEEETESFKNFEEESDNVGLDTELVAVTEMNTGGEGAEVGGDKRLGMVGSEEGAEWGHERMIWLGRKMMGWSRNTMDLL